MKTFSSLVALFFVSVALGVTDPTPKLTDVPLTKIFVPHGFDTNDYTQVMVSGEFESTCFKKAGYQMVPDPIKKRVYITQQAYEYDGVCLRMFVPFHRVVDLDILSQEGDWKLFDGSTGLQISKVHIDEARDSGIGTDNEYYAPLHDAHIVENQNGTPELVLKGAFSNSCMKFKEVDIEVQSDVIVVRPIVKPPETLVADTFPSKCRPGQYEFTKRKEIKGLSRKQPYLLHVRAMDGEAFNRLYVAP